jgi:uncharacterized membrane protein
MARRDGWQDLGSEAGAIPCGTSLSGAYGLNRDGSLGVGLLWRAAECKANAGTWDLVNGGPPTVLPTLLAGPATRANAVNADGNIVVGWQDQLNGQRAAAKWVNSVPELITNPDGALNGEAHAVSADGSIIVGEGYNFGRESWIWREGTGVRALGMTAHGWINGTVVALDVSDDGRVVVGFTRRGQRPQRAFIWRSGQGAAYLDEFLNARGAVVPAGWTLSVGSLISADGNTIYGWGSNPEGSIEMFKVDLAE